MADRLHRWRRLIISSFCLAVTTGVLLANLPSQFPHHVEGRVRDLLKHSRYFRNDCAHELRPYTLDHIRQSSYVAHYPVNRILEVDTGTNDYWTGGLTSLDDAKSVLLPVYPAYEDTRRALIYVPAGVQGTYNFTLRIPRLAPTDNDPPLEWEPPHCMAYRGLDDRARMYEQTPSKVWRHMLDFCRVQPNGTQFNGTRSYVGAIRDGGALSVAPYRPYNETIYFTAHVKFWDEAAPDSDVDGKISIERLEALARMVYGPSASSFLPGSLGHYQRDYQRNGISGSPFYQPQREHCLSMFHNTLDQPGCATALTDAYRWRPMGTNLHDWMIPTDTLRGCLKGKRLRIYGDSLAWALYRGFTCLSTGYGGLEEGKDFYLDRMHYLNVDFAPLFAPRSAGVTIDMSEAAKLLDIEDSLGVPDIEVYLVGMWLISYLPSPEWKRGHETMLRAIKYHAELRGSKAYIALATSPNTDPAYAGEPLWQSADRAFLWNKSLRAAAHRFGLPLIDTFWPTVNRHDARIDNCHFCDTVSYDQAAIVAKTVCESYHR